MLSLYNCMLLVGRTHFTWATRFATKFARCAHQLPRVTYSVRGLGLLLFICLVALQGDFLFIYFLSIIVAVFCSIFKNMLPRRVVLGCFSLTLALLVFRVTSILFCLFMDPQVFMAASYLNIFLSNSVSYGLVLYLDFYSASFISLTLFIGLVAMVYGAHYMRMDPYQVIFIIYLNWFILSMVLLLLAGNFCTLVLGWELIGITSFLLINFFSSKNSVFKAALKAFIFNKISDIGLLLFTVFSVVALNGGLLWDNRLLLCWLATSETPLYWLFLGSLLISAFCKSAQLGFHVWLPDSMEAPVPASALIHSATLVSAGVYIVGRYSTLFSPLVGYLLPYTLWTAVYGALVACAQNDLKKILAYSTISHCGVLFSLLWLGDIHVVLIYLYTHGFFKAFSFMLVGQVLEKNGLYQDSRRFSGNLRGCGLEWFVLPIFLFNLGLLPFSLGFFSKTALVATTYGAGIALLSGCSVFILAVSSLVYVSRVLYQIFFGINRSATHGKLSFYISTQERLFVYLIAATTICYFSLVYFLWFNFWVSGATTFIGGDHYLVSSFLPDNQLLYFLLIIFLLVFKQQAPSYYFGYFIVFFYVLL